MLVTCNNLIITFGQFVAACVCGAFSKVEPDGWKWMLGLAGIPAVIQFVGFLFMPESPRWLVSHGKFDEAKKVLFKIRAPDENPEQEFREIQRAVEEEKVYTTYVLGVQARNMKMDFKIYGTWRRVG